MIIAGSVTMGTKQLQHQNNYIGLSSPMSLPYFFGYKTEFFFFQSNPKDLDLSCKMDLDLSDCLGRVKLVL